MPPYLECFIEVDYLGALGVGYWGMGPYPECVMEADDVGVLGCCVSDVGVCHLTLGVS